MKPRPKFYLALACLLLALPASAARAQTPELMTEKKALAVIAAWDKAGRAGKVDDITPYLAEDIRLKVIFDIFGETKQIEMGRDQFIAESKRGTAKRVAYEGERQKTEVAVAKDGQSAIVTSEMFEELTSRYGSSTVTVKSLSSEVFVIKLRGGKAVVTSFYATMSLFP